MSLRLITLCLLGAAAQFHACAIPSGAETSAGTTAQLLDRFLQSAEPRLISYRARRVLEASSMGGRMNASLEAMTYLDSDGTFRFDVVAESGSSLIRERVLTAALLAEQRSRNRRETSEAELTPANYQFEVRPGESPDTLRLGLIPRRRSPMLLHGNAVVTASGADLLRIEGSPSELPSYWTTRVDIVRQYARIAGVRVATEMRSRAAVRIAGESSFSMTYAYTMINGKDVTHLRATVRQVR